MTELLRDWVLGITAVSLAGAAAQALAGTASARRMVRLIAAFALLLAVTLPLQDTDADDLRRTFERYARDLSHETAVTTAATDDLLCEVTAERLAAYVEQLGREQGIDCRAAVTVAVRDGVAWPVSCEVWCEAADADALRAAVAAALGTEEVIVRAS